MGEKTKKKFLKRTATLAVVLVLVMTSIVLPQNTMEVHANLHEEATCTSHPECDHIYIIDKTNTNQVQACRFTSTGEKMDPSWMDLKTGKPFGTVEPNIGDWFYYPDGGSKWELCDGHGPAAEPLAGTVTISGTAKFGEILTADTTGITTTITGNLSYQWKSGGSNIGTNSKTYTVTASDIGKTITVTVTSSVETSSLTSTATATIAKANGPAAPSVTGVACTTTDNNDGKITGTTTAMEYSTTTDFASATSCSGTEIPDLTNGTYYVRLKATATHEAGAYATVVVNAFNTNPPSPPRGGSGGSSDGSSSSGITVPVSGEGTTNVTANVSGNNATVSVNTNAINNAAGNNGQTGTDTITVNLSGLRQTVTSTTISKTDASNIAKTLNSSDNNKKFVEFKMSEYTVKIDSTAMNAVVNATTGNDLRLVVETTAPAAALNNNQQSELNNKEVARTFEAYFVSNGNRIGNFDGGKVEIGVVEFKVPAGKNGSFYHVEYLPETGKAVRHQTRYVDGYLYFDTTHFSDYAIVYDEGVANGPEAETTDDTEGTIDTGEVITTVKSPRTGDTMYFEVLTMTILANALIVLAMALKMRDAKVVAEDKSHKNYNSYKDAGEYLERFFRK